MSVLFWRGAWMLADRTVAYPASFDDDYDEEGIFDAVEPKLTRPLSIASSPRMRTGMMTPGDFASLQEGREGLSTEDYIAWKLP
jgi:glycogen synthase